ncbi:hypothetical protein [Frondihabitans sucicola]|nr:hypothetical protein [Frondihabitans sucicola]
MTAALRSSSVRVSILRRVAVGALVVAAATALAGCTTTPPSSATSKAGSASDGSGGGAGSDSGDSEPSATPTGGAGVLDASTFTMPCDTLVPAATVDAAYAGMNPLGSPDAPKKSDAAVIGSYDGTVCSWKNASGTTMTLAVGKFSPASLTRLKNSLVVSSNPVPTYDGEGYFTLDGATGTAEAFTSDYWVVATSADPTFGEPGGAEPSSTPPSRR